MPVRSSGPLRLALIAALLLVAAAADGPPSPGPAPGRSTGSPGPSASSDGGGVLRYALVEPTSIDPAFAADEAGLAVVDALFDPLTRLTPDGDVVGAAATDWEVSADARTFTFTLRDARFHDGTPVRAEDFVRGFARVAGGSAEHEPAHPELLTDVEGFEAAHLAGAPLAGVEATGPRELRIRLKEPRADLPEIVSHPALAPVPPSADREPGSFGRSPVGNGPFRIDGGWEGGGEIHLVRNGEHPDRPPLGGVTFVLYAGEDAEQLAHRDLRDGELDVAPFLPPQQPGVSPSPGPSARPSGGTATPTVSPVTSGGSDVAAVYAYGFVTDRPPFDDPAVRQAFSLAIDRAALASPLHDVDPADALIPPGVPGHRAGACGRCRTDRARASLLMAGRPAPRVRLLVTDDEQAVAAARQVAADVTAATGMDVDVISAPVARYLARLDAGEADVFGLWWNARTPSPDDLLYRSFSSRKLGVTNLTRYASPEVDALLERARATIDRGARLDLYRRVEQRVLDDAVVIPIWYDRAGHAASPAVRGLVFDAWGRPDLTRVGLAP